ncbi:MAG: SipW-dependent-type signal peptide-containing protein [Bacillota bacterium]|uniref:SipW-dependent-type signal peptide-containing protein n=1 Tax=Desulforudis sp. DRI-14 TaxID=3459793 RepID=UPI003498B4D4
MRKSVLLVMVYAVLVLGLAAGGTLAWFTATASNDDNVFTSGTLIIGASNAGANTGTMNFMGEPGKSTSYTVTVKNLGSLPFWYKVSAALEGGDSDLYDALVVSIDGGPEMPLPSLTDHVLNLNLASGAQEDKTFTIKLPTSAGNNLQGKSATISLTFHAEQVATTPSNAGLINAGFEDGNLSGWTKVSEADSVAVVGADGFASPMWGSYMARLGDDNGGSPGEQPEGDNAISQTFTALGSNLVFAYNIFTYDYDPYDNFTYTVTAMAGSTVIDSFSTTAFGDGEGLVSTGWQTKSLDLTGYVGQDITFYVTAGGTLDNALPTWAYLDLPE